MASGTIVIPGSKKVFLFHHHETMSVQGERVPHRVPLEIPFAGTFGIEASVGAALSGVYEPVSDAQFEVVVQSAEPRWDNTTDKTYLDVNLLVTALGTGDVRLKSVIVFGAVQG